MDIAAIAMNVVDKSINSASQEMQIKIIKMNAEQNKAMANLLAQNVENRKQASASQIPQSKFSTYA